MTLAREGFPGAHIARHCGIFEAAVSREFSRQFSQSIPLEKRSKRHEASAAHTRNRENRETSNPRGKLLPPGYRDGRKINPRVYSPEQMANTVLKGQASTVSFTAGCTPASCFMEIGLCSGIKAGGAFSGRKEKQYKAGKSVHTRPASIERRSEFGHFGVDTVESGRNGTGRVFTIAERKTRMLFACRAESCTAENFYNALKKLIKILSLGTIKSLIGDRGKEFAWYQKIENKMLIPFYFADPHSPWQKGANENTNGLWREIFPKKTNFSTVS